MYDVKPVTTPHQTACGPTALKMLLDYYGQDAALEDLIRECKITVTGCSAATLLRVGRAHGLEGMAAYQMDAQDALTMDRPAILWWRFVHYVVFCGLNDAGEPVICNPSSGRFPISREAFVRHFSGVALTNGKAEDYVPRALGNYAEGEIFQAENETWIALRPITREEKLVDGWNCEHFDLIAALNTRKEKEE